MPLKEVLVVADVNEIWRLKPFQALSNYMPVMGVRPQDLITTLRWDRRLYPFQSVRKTDPDFYTLSVKMIPFWASRFAYLAQPFLWRRIRSACNKQELNIRYLVVTIPHYWRMLKWVSKEIQVIYYVSDDYRQYRGWNPSQLLGWENAVMQRANYAFFVSRSLADRAKLEYPHKKDNIYISMNATEPAFFANAADEVISPPSPYAELRRPIVGVIGTINDSLDFNLLYRCANLPDIGTLLFVGPGSENMSELSELKACPKAVFVGKRPHAELPQWMHSVDIALIPYKEREVNRYRSPMRLFDHLASGCPVIATSSCEQVVEFSSYICVAGNQDEFIAILLGKLHNPETVLQRQERIVMAQSHTWENRMAAFFEIIQKRNSAHELVH